MPRDIDTLGRVDGEIEERVTSRQSHGTRNARAKLVETERSANSGIDADKERKGY